MRIVRATLLLLLATWCAGEILECNIISSKSPELRLKRHLFCEYDPSIRPVAQKNTSVNVTVRLMPTMMEFVDRSGLFVLHSWVVMSWSDDHLTWKSDDFEGLSMLRVRSDEIWVPDFSLYNAGEISSPQNSGIPQTMCQLYSSGDVVCVPAMKLSALCETSYTYWPYDTQTCKLRLGSWSHTGEEINFEFSNPPISLQQYTENKEWLISNFSTKRSAPKYSCCPNDTFPTLYAVFNLERHSPMLHSVYISPVIVLMVITLTVLWLDSRSTERISLGALNFICHIICSYDLHWMLPVNGSNPPHILLFYRDSMVLATFAMLVTSALRKLQSTKVPAPGWIVATVRLVASNRAGRILLLDAGLESEDEAAAGAGRDVEGSSEATLAEVAGKPPRPDAWRKLAVIVEWLAFLVGLLAYAVMILVLVPMSGYPSRTKFYEAA